MTLTAQLKARLHTDNRAVSPVIGVVLMVAITVILAALVGTFVLGTGSDATKSGPTASLKVTASGGADTITLEHQGGDGLHSAQTKIVVEAGGSTGTFTPAANDGIFSVGETAEMTLTGGTDTIDWTGDGAVATADGDYSQSTTAGTFTSGDTVRVTLIDVESEEIIFETELAAK